MSDEPLIVGFASLDEMFAFIQANHAIAVSNTSPEQWAIADGNEHYWFRHAQGIDIFGHVPALVDSIAAERKFYPEVMDAEDEAEFRYSIDDLNRRLADGYVFGMCYSDACIEGELGSTHVSQLLEISKKTFEYAQSVNWATPV